jgi:hypothetical protein
MKLLLKAAVYSAFEGFFFAEDDFFPLFDITAENIKICGNL